VTTSLTELHMSGCHINVTDMKIIAAGLKENKSIHTLDICYNLTKLKTGRKPLIQSLNSNRSIHFYSPRLTLFSLCVRTLTKLKMKGTGMHENDVKDLEKVLRDNTTLSDLDVSDNDLAGSEASWTEILSRNTLKRLKLSFKGMNNKALLTPLASCTSLRHLDLTVCKWSNVQIHPGFAKMALINTSNLTHLDFSGNIFKSLEMDVVGRTIQNNTSLTFLDFGNLEEIKVKGRELLSLARSIGKNTSLISLSMCTASGIDVDKRKMEKYICSNSSLTTIHLSDIDRWGFDDLIFRNRGYWRERLRCGWRIVVLSRLFLLSSNGTDILPTEIIFHILSSIPASSLLSERRKRKMIKYGVDKKTLSGDKMDFVCFVFGADINLSGIGLL